MEIKEQIIQEYLSTGCGYRKLQQHIFKWAFVPGWTINEFPTFANTRTLVAMLLATWKVTTTAIQYYLITEVKES